MARLRGSQCRSTARARVGHLILDLLTHAAGMSSNANRVSRPGTRLLCVNAHAGGGWAGILLHMAEDDGSGGIEYTTVDRAYMAKGGAELQLASPPLMAGPGDGFMIDPYPAQQCIEWLTRIADDVRRSLTEVGNLSFAPPGGDQVSVNLSANADSMAKSAEAYVYAWADQIDAARQGLQAQFDAYQNVDAEIAAELT